MLALIGDHVQFVSAAACGLGTFCILSCDLRTSLLTGWHGERISSTDQEWKDYSHESVSCSLTRRKAGKLPDPDPAPAPTPSPS